MSNETNFERCDVEWCDRRKGHLTLHSASTTSSRSTWHKSQSSPNEGRDARGPILVYAPEHAPFDLIRFVRAEISREFEIVYIAEIPPGVDNPLDEAEILSELFSHPRKEGWGLFVSYSRALDPSD